MGSGNRVFQNTVLGALPQDFNFTGDDSELIIGNDNTIRENVVINRATFRGDTRYWVTRTRCSRGTFRTTARLPIIVCFGYGVKLSGNSVIDSHAIIGSSAVVRGHVAQWVWSEAVAPFRQGYSSYIIVSGNPTHYYDINSIVLTKQFPENSKHIATAYRLIYHGNTSIFDALMRIHDQVPMSPEIENIINFVA